MCQAQANPTPPRQAHGSEGSLPPTRPRRVARGAERHQVGRVEPPIRILGDLGDVVDFLSRLDAVLASAVNTERVGLKVREAQLTPVVVVSAA